MSQNESTEPVPFRQSLQESVQVNGSFSFVGRVPGVPLYGFGGRSEWFGMLTLYRMAPQLQPPRIVREWSGNGIFTSGADIFRKIFNNTSII